MNESADGVIEARKIILRDSHGRVRLELAGEAFRVSGAPPSAVEKGPEVAIFDMDGRRRISIRVQDEDLYGMNQLAEVAFYGFEERCLARLLAFGEEAMLSFHAKDGHTGLHAGFRQFDERARPEIVLAGPHGWRMMLVVAEDRPHVALYDGDNAPRLHLTVDQQGAPHVRRHSWRWLIPRWRWHGYYPSLGANG